MSTSWGNATDNTPATELLPATAAAPEAKKETEAPNVTSSTSVESVEKSDTKKDEAAAVLEKVTEGLEKIGIVGSIHPADSDAKLVMKNKDSIYRSAKSFEELGLSKELLRGVFEKKFVTPSKIQAEALPVILDKTKVNNFIGQAHAGSGKTATYALGMLSRVDASKNIPQALCVVPTRELAIQVAGEIEQLAKFTEIKVGLAIPGSERAKLSTHVVVGTPGTILAKISKKELQPNGIIILTLDEADHMLEKSGLGDQTAKIRSKLSKKNNVQVLLFSATFQDRVRAFAEKIAGPKAVSITVERDQMTLASVDQYFMDCKNDPNKQKVLQNLFDLTKDFGHSIIFVETVAAAKTLTNQMRDADYSVSLLHGQLDKEERDKVMDDFRHGRTTILITTNVLSRGIDVLQVAVVINYDIPLNKFGKPDPETYIHRVGRAGRFGRKGVAINFVSNQASVNNLKAIMDFYGAKCDELPAEDLEALSIKLTALGLAED